MPATTLPAFFATVRRECGAISPPPPTRDDGWRRAEDRLLEFWNWSDDWDGEGAAAPSHDALRGAFSLVRQLADSDAANPAAGPRFLDRPPDRLLPGRDGSIIVEWQFPDFGYAELEVVSATEANGMLVFTHGRPTLFESIRITADPVTSNA